MKLTWFGHSAFRLEFGNCRVMIDPFLTGNPSFDGDAKQAAAGATHVLVTHGHNDHLGDAISICKENGAMLVANAEIADWAWGQGFRRSIPETMVGRSIAAASPSPSSTRCTPRAGRRRTARAPISEIPLV